MISWIFDLNYKYSYLYLVDKRIIEKKFNSLEIYGETKDITKLKKFIEENIDQKLGE